MNQTFMDCLTFNELQNLGRESISMAPTSTIPNDPEPAYEIKPTQKRVRFVFDDQPKAEKLLKSDYFIVISRKISLVERENMSKWLDDRGFELIWSFEAALEYSNRDIIFIDQEFNGTNPARHPKIKQSIKITPQFSIEKAIIIEGAYFWIQT